MQLLGSLCPGDAEGKFMNERIREAICFFTRETRIMDCLAVVCGRNGRREAAWDGREIGPGTLFDLASVTKIFTGLCLMRLWEEGRLDPFRRVTGYCPEFHHLHEVTVEQLMGFQVQLKTPERIDSQRSREDALACLREVCPTNPPGKRAYSDIPAMILKYVAERAADRPLMDCVKEMILRPAGMESTYAGVPAEREKDCLLYGPEYRIEGEKRICRMNPVRGVPHDPKAAILQGKTGDLCGHAGLFSSMEDMEKLALALIRGKIVTMESMRRMAVNRTGRQLPDGTYTQYLGYLCYLKHPDQYFSEIPAGMSLSAFGIGGFTGNHFSVDPTEGRYTIFLGNRVRDRLTVLIPPTGKKLTDYGLRPDGIGQIRWEDGRMIPSSVNYVHQKDEHLHAVTEAVLSGQKGLWPEEAIHR